MWAIAISDKISVPLHSVTNTKKKKTKLAWNSYRTRAAMDRVLLYSETTIKRTNSYTTHSTVSNKFENRRAK